MQVACVVNVVPVRQVFEAAHAGLPSTPVRPEAVQDSSQPFGNLVRVVVHPPTQFGSDAPQGPADSLAHRLAPQPEPPASRRQAVVREPEEVEGVRAPFASCAAARSGEPAELDEAGFVGVQLQGERGQPRLQVAQKPLCIPLVLESDHEIIGVTHDDGVTDRSGAPFLLEPQVEDVVQVDVRQNRRDNRALRGAPQVIPPFALFHDAGIEPLDNQPNDPPVADSVFQEPDEPVPVNTVEVRPDVRIGNPVDSTPLYPEGQGVERIVRPTPGSEPIAESEEHRLVYRRKDGLCHRLLDDFVLQCGDAKRSCSPVRLRYLHPP